MKVYRMVIVKIFEWSQVGKRSIGRPRNKWGDEVLKDIRVMGGKY
jgi:hypothetical protein